MFRVISNISFIYSKKFRGTPKDVLRNPGGETLARRCWRFGGPKINNKHTIHKKVIKN